MKARKIVYISITQVLAIHDQMIKRFGGLGGVRDIGLIESAVARPQATFDSQDLYRTLFDKAAALLQSLLKNHPFADGNKRTALTSAGLFLTLNGYRLINSHEEEVDFAIQVDNEHLTLEKISQWLHSNSTLD